MSTNGCRKLVGNSSFCRNAARPVSCRAGLHRLVRCVDLRLRGLPLEPGAGLHEVGGQQAEEQRDDGGDEEVAERPQRQPTRAGEVAERGDADDHRAEDDRPDHHLDELDEQVGEDLELLGEAGGHQAHHDAEGDAHQHPEPQLRVDPLLPAPPAVGVLRRCGGLGHGTLPTSMAGTARPPDGTDYPQRTHRALRSCALRSTVPIWTGCGSSMAPKCGRCYARAGEPTVLRAAPRASRQSRSRLIGSSCGRTPSVQIALPLAAARGLS